MNTSFMSNFCSKNERGPLHEAVVRRDAATAQVLITAGTFTQHEDEVPGQ